MVNHRKSYFRLRNEIALLLNYISAENYGKQFLQPIADPSRKLFRIYPLGKEDYYLMNEDSLISFPTHPQKNQTQDPKSGISNPIGSRQL